MPKVATDLLIAVMLVTVLITLIRYSSEAILRVKNATKSSFVVICLTSARFYSGDKVTSSEKISHMLCLAFGLFLYSV